MRTLSKIGHKKKCILEDLTRKAVTDILSQEKNGSVTFVNKTLTSLQDSVVSYSVPGGFPS